MQRAKFIMHEREPCRVRARSGRRELQRMARVGRPGDRPCTTSWVATLSLRLQVLVGTWRRVNNHTPWLSPGMQPRRRHSQRPPPRHTKQGARLVGNPRGMQRQPSDTRALHHHLRRGGHQGSCLAAPCPLQVAPLDQVGCRVKRMATAEQVPY